MPVAGAADGTDVEGDVVGLGDGISVGDGA